MTPAQLLLAMAAAAADWPQWRGADQDGISLEETAFPTHWSKTENVRWRVALPEPGNSTPVVWGDRIFVTQAVKASGRRLLMCFDRATGKLRWQAGVAYTEEEPTHSTNPYASASPATDGERVVAWFGSAGLHAFDMDGKPLWKRDLGRQRHTWGYGASPIIHSQAVFLNFGPGERSFLIALDKRTGKTIWQVDVPAGKGAPFNQWSADDMYGSWSTPIVVRAAGRQELIVAHPRRLVSYDPSTGKILWSSEGLGDLVYPSPVADSTHDAEPVIVAASGFQGPVMAVRAGGRGDVTATHRLWHWPKNRQFIGTGVIRNGYLYWADNGGVAQCVRLTDGTVAWTARLPRAGEDGGVWSSPVLHKDNIYVMNKSGAVVVFKADPQRFEAVAVNALDEPSNSSVVLSGGDIILRTHAALWCIGRRR